MSTAPPISLGELDRNYWSPEPPRDRTVELYIYGKIKWRYKQFLQSSNERRGVGGERSRRVARFTTAVLESSRTTYLAVYVLGTFILTIFHPNTIWSKSSITWLLHLLFYPGQLAQFFLPVKRKIATGEFAHKGDEIPFTRTSCISNCSRPYVLHKFELLTSFTDNIWKSMAWEYRKRKDARKDHYRCPWWIILGHLMIFWGRKTK